MTIAVFGSSNSYRIYYFYRPGLLKETAFIFIHIYKLSFNEGKSYSPGKNYKEL